MRFAYRNAVNVRAGRMVVLVVRCCPGKGRVVVGGWIRQKKCRCRKPKGTEGSTRNRGCDREGGERFKRGLDRKKYEKQDVC